MSSQAYGHQLAEALNARQSQSFVIRSKLEQTRIAVTRIKCDVADNAMTAPVANEDAVLLMVQLRDWPTRNLWADGRAVNASPLSTGAFSIFDLRTTWIGHRVCPIDQVNFYLPRSALNEISDVEGWRRVSEFENDPVKGGHDPVLWGLTRSLIPAFERGGEADQLFVDHITAAAAAHVVGRHGVGAHKLGMRDVTALSNRQSRAATELIDANLHGRMTVDALAAAAELPVSRFIRGFESTHGMPPHRFLLRQRVARAMHMLQATRRSLDEIARETGFDSQAHLERVFFGIVGVNPSIWRDIRVN